MSYIKINSRWNEDSMMNWRSQCGRYINKTSLQNWRLFSCDNKVSRFTNLAEKQSLYTILYDLIYIEFQKIKIKPVSDVRSHNCVYLDGLIPANLYKESFRMLITCIIYLSIYNSIKGTRNLWINQRCRKKLLYRYSQYKKIIERNENNR